MSAIKFRYRKERGPLGFVHRPVASVILQNGSRQLEALMYIDSGADITTIPLEAGKALGLRQLARERLLAMRGISGPKVPYLIKRAAILLDGVRIRIRLAWSLSDRVPFLLGRMDVFPRFEVIFRESKRAVIFRALGAIH